MPLQPLKAAPTANNHPRKHHEIAKHNLECFCDELVALLSKLIDPRHRIAHTKKADLLQDFAECKIQHLHIVKQELDLLASFESAYLTGRSECSRSAPSSAQHSDQSGERPKLDTPFAHGDPDFFAASGRQHSSLARSELVETRSVVSPASPTAALWPLISSVIDDGFITPIWKISNFQIPANGGDRIRQLDDPRLITSSQSKPTLANAGALLYEQDLHGDLSSIKRPVNRRILRPNLPFQRCHTAPDKMTATVKQHVNLHLIRCCALLADSQVIPALSAATSAFQLAEASHVFDEICKAQLYRGICFMRLGRWREAKESLVRAANVKGWASSVWNLTREVNQQLERQRRERFGRRDRRGRIGT